MLLYRMQRETPGKSVEPQLISFNCTSIERHGPDVKIFYSTSKPKEARHHGEITQISTNSTCVRNVDLFRGRLLESGGNLV